MLTPRTAERVVADRVGAVFCSLVSLVCGCALLGVLGWEEDAKLGSMPTLLFGAPLFLAAVAASIGSALLAARLAGLAYSPKVATPLAILAFVPGVGLVIALAVSRKVSEFLRSHGLRVGRCLVCSRHFVDKDAAGVCLTCLRGIS